MPENTEALREKYSKILRDNGILDTVAKVTVMESGAKGDGMLSLTQCVTVTFEDKDKDPLNLFVKLHTGNPSHEAMLEDTKAFEKEARFFMNYFPLAKEFCESKGFPELIDFYPKCYYGDENLIVLENLLKKGYALCPHDKRHDFNTSAVALRTLAKHHALSYAMIQESGGDEKFFEKFPNLNYDSVGTPMMVAMTVQFFVNSWNTAELILEKSQSDDVAKALATLKSFNGTFTEVYLDTIRCNREVEKLLVLIHGDYKNNNMMMLTDKKTNDILHHIAIDFQVTRYNSPGLDLVYYFYSSVDPKIRQSKLEDLLNIYRETLNDVSKSLGHPIELTYQDLHMQFRRKIKFGLAMGLAMAGPGMGLVKTAGIDVSELDMSNLAQIFHQCLLDWIEQNPDKGKDLLEEIKNLVDEYNKLAI